MILIQRRSSFVCQPNDLRFPFSISYCSSNHGFPICFLVMLLNLKPACLHTSFKFCVNNSVISSTLLLSSAEFSLLFVSLLSKSRRNSYFQLLSHTSCLDSLSVISSDRFPEHFFFCVSALMRVKGNNGPIGGTPNR